MKKNFFIILLTLFSVTIVCAQTKAVIPKLDVNKMAKMTPAELEEYKKQLLKDLSASMKKTAADNHIQIDETLLPDYELKMPPKDEKRIATIPAGVPSLPQLTNSVKATKQKLEALTTKDILYQVIKIVREKNAAQLQSASVAEWYGNNPIPALLLSMESVLKNPDTAIAWNNLAALYNMSGLEEKAVPILKHWLVKFFI